MVAQTSWQCSWRVQPEISSSVFTGKYSNMAKFYCDYCDIHLTHDSRRVRKDHESGWKHRLFVQNYYANLEAHKVQSIIHNITKAYVYAGLGGFPELPTPGHESIKSKMPAGMPSMLPPPQMLQEMIKIQQQMVK